MPDPAPDRLPATSVNSAYWAVLRGRLAGATGGEAVVNPHGDGAGASALSAALALCWAWGQGSAQADDTVSRETFRPGRGRGRLGPRAEWRDAQIEVLRLARSGGQGKLTDRDLAAIVGKSHDAVRAKLARRRAAEARSQPDPDPPTFGAPAP